MVLTPSTGKKRKNDENTPVTVPPKKARIIKDGSHSAVAVLVDTILANPKACVVPSSEEAVRSVLVDIALYARSLEQQEPAMPVHVANSVESSDTTAPVAAASAAKSQEQLKEEAETIRRTAQTGIGKLMGWKPTCNTGRTKWCYDGFCPDPEVFGVLLGLGGPPKWSIKKFKTDEFTKLMGRIEGSVRYVRYALYHERRSHRALARQRRIQVQRAVWKVSVQPEDEPLEDIISHPGASHVHCFEMDVCIDLRGGPTTSRRDLRGRCRSMTDQTRDPMRYVL